MTTDQENSGPWWKFGHVWLLVAGPLVVIVASFITIYLAVSRPDPVTDEEYSRKGAAMGKAASEDPNSLAPAMKARNHAQTGVVAPTEKK